MNTITDNNKNVGTATDEQDVNTSAVTQDGKNADTSAFPEEDQTRAGLLEEAKKEAVQAIDKIAENDVASDNALWRTMEATLRLAETFATEDAVKAYYERLTNKSVHGNTTNPWQLIVKLSLPAETDSGWKTRFGQALAALIREGVKSDRVMDELAERKPLDKIATKKAPTYSGISRFVLLYKKQEQERKKREKREAADNAEGPSDANSSKPEVPETNTSTSNQNRYLTMPEDRLKVEALHIFEALKAKNIVPTKFLKLEDVLRLPSKSTPTH